MVAIVGRRGEDGSPGDNQVAGAVAVESERRAAPGDPGAHAPGTRALAGHFTAFLEPAPCYDDQQLVFTSSSVGFILWQDLRSVRNRSIQKQARYRNEKRGGAITVPREQLEKTSCRFSIKFLLGVLNSAVARHLLRANRRSNVHLYNVHLFYPDDWKLLPIPDVSPEQQEPIIEYVDRILKAKSANPAADTSAEEVEIDRLVYALYGMTDAEISAVEGKGQFQVVPNHSGLVPSVTADNLKDIIHDLEDEEFLEKIGK